MGCREQPRYPVYRRTEVVPTPLLGRSCVQSHPHPKGPGLPAPLLGEERPLGLKSGFESVKGDGESGAEGVAHGLEDVAASLLDGVP